MAAKKKPKVSFEEGMASLDELVLSMQKGDMPLEELMGAYEKGMALAAQHGTRPGSCSPVSRHRPAQGSRRGPSDQASARGVSAGERPW